PIERLKKLSFVQWLVIAAVFHLIFTLVIFLVGHFRILPSHFDQNDVGDSFTVDGVVYQSVITNLSNALLQQGWDTWYNTKAPLHCRIYSFSFIFPGSIVG